MKKASGLRKFVNYLVPLIEKYDATSEANVLLKDDRVNYFGRERIEEALCGSYSKKKGFMFWSRFADTADRCTSLVGAGLEVLGLLIGLAPGVALNLKEEVLEMVCKLPALGYILADKNERYRATELVVKEAATLGLPVLGDAYDVATNLWVDTAKDIIREDAVRNLEDAIKLLSDD